MSDSTYTVPPVRDPQFIPDTTVVRHFRSGTATGFLPRLNLDLGLSLTEKGFLRLQTYFKNTALRDPTVGELRILNAVSEAGAASPARIAVGELLTVSPALAETWADMMAKHGALHGRFNIGLGSSAATPPATLTQLLSLTGRYLYGTGLRTEEDSVLLTTPAQEAVAAASGYEPVARMRVGNGERSLWKRRVAMNETPCRNGDMLLYLPRLTPDRVGRLLAEDEKQAHPALGALRAVADASLLSVIRSLCPAAELFVSRLTEGEAGGKIPVDRLCAQPTMGADGTCGYMARVPLKQMQTMNQMLSDCGITSVACGRVRTGGNLVFLLQDGAGIRDIPAATLPADLLAEAAAPHLYAMKPMVSSITSPAPHLPDVARFPSVTAAENGLSPDGREVVTLTRIDGRILSIPETDTILAVHEVDIPSADTGYTAAAETVAATAQNLEAVGISPTAIRLTVSLTVPSQRTLTHGDALGVICGVYCAAAQLGLPVEDSVMEKGDSDVPMRLAVTAWAKDGETCRRLTDEGRDRQWHTARQAVQKDTPDFVLPILRRSYESCLHGLSAALSRNRSVACALRPLAMNQTTDEETGLTSYTLHPESEKKLLELLSTSAMPVFSLNEGDTRLLLSHPSVCEALRARLERGGTVLVLGESCAAFSAFGFLPAALARTETVPVPDGRVTAVYAFPAEPATRLVRVPLLTPVCNAGIPDASHILSLHLPDGRVIPDGFVGGDGRVLGLCNGLDTTILQRLGCGDFSLPSLLDIRI